MRFHEPGLDTAGAFDDFDFHGVSGPGKGNEKGEREHGHRHRESDTRDAKRPTEHIH
jgi:hypothetical protein